ncbi:MAG: glycosyltransferase family 4 protein [Candidatus Aceula meridiana]|nr:glycosyltransferase family 4 protein [Candidatus Aceula meridiana]
MKKNKSVLIITERFYPEEFGINDLALAWRAKGFEVAVLTQLPSYPFDKIYDGYTNKLFQKEKWEGIKIYRVCSLMGYRKNVFLKVLNYLWFAFLASFTVLFIGRKYDAIFVYQVGPLTQAIPAMIAKTFFQIKMYLWTLDIWPDTVYAYGFKRGKFSAKLLNWFVGLVYRNCETVFISCRGFKEKIQCYAPNACIVFAPQWAPSEMNFRDIRSQRCFHEGFNFTFAGNIGKVQNLENVIRVFCLAQRRYRDMNLNIIGDGSHLECLKDIASKEKVQNVFFWGRQPLKEMPQWFEESDALIISLVDKPIFSLTVPAKFQAYLASRKPIFCVMRGETASLVKDYNIGLIADPADENAIQSGFENFFNLPQEKAREFKKNMHILLEKEFDHDKVIQRMTKKIFDVFAAEEGASS